MILDPARPAAGAAWRSRALGGLALAATLALAGWVRVTGYRVVIDGGEAMVAPLDGDNAYHLWRTLEAIRVGGRPAAFDPAMAWPAGAAAPWAPGYDLLGAAWVRLLGGGDDPRGRLLALLFPAVVGLLLVAATWELARRLARGRGRIGAAVAAALVVALLPELRAATALGRCDHHGLEALAVLLLACWALAVARRPGQRPARLALEAAGAAAVTFAAWTFAGAYLYVALAVLALVAQRVLRPAGPLVGSGAPGLAAGAAAALALAVPEVRDHGQRLSFLYPSYLQPALLAAGAGAVAAAWLVARRVRAPTRRAGWLAALLAAGAAAAFLAPGLGRELRSGLVEWVLHRDPWLDSIIEFRPLLRDGLPPAAWWLGRAWLLLVPLAAWTAAAGLRPRPRPAATALACFLLPLALLTLAQVRFGRVLLPLVAAGGAAALATLAARLPLRWRAAAPLAVPLLAAALVLTDPRARAALRVAPAQPLEAERDLATALALLPVVPGAPGVLAPWSEGHVLRVFGGRPVVTNGFGHYLGAARFAEAGALLGRDAAALEGALDAWRVGVLVAGPGLLEEAHRASGLAPFDPRGLHEPFFRRFPLATVLTAGSGVPAWGVPHLGTLRPRASSRETIPGLPFALPFGWIYDRVPGARVVGRAPPGSRVVAELPFREWGRPHLWRGWADAGPDGRFALRLPLPGGWTSYTLQAGSWTLRAGDGPSRPLHVPPEAVERGLDVDAGGP